VSRRLDYGFPTVFGRGLYEEFRNILNPPFLIVTMPDLWERFRPEFEGADFRLHLVRSLEQSRLDRDAAELGDVRTVLGLGGGRALDAAKYFAWRRNLPLFQAPTALSVDAVYSHRAAVREAGRVLYRGYAAPQCVFIDYDVLRSAPRALNWSGVGDVLCFHTGVLDWKYARGVGRLEEKWPYDEDLALQSLEKVQTILESIDAIHDMTDAGIHALVDGLKWGTSFQGAGWCPRHIEGTDHFLFYTLEALTGRAFLHGQPVGLGVVVGSMLHETGAELMLDAFARIGLDVRPEAMGLSWDQAIEGLTGMRAYVRSQPLWHSIAHDAEITPGFVSDLKRRLDTAYAHLA